MKRIAGSADATAGLPASLSGTAPSSLADPTFSEAVIVWQRRHGRHALPWQQTRDAYRIWLSEIMLQQTQVTAVIPYYARFLDRFPDVQSLAAASIEDVMALWSGLGYYSRARNLHRCAIQVCADHAGMFPHDPEVLATLPGIGRSTAAAIAAFAYGARAAILDGNVKRVFSRVFGIEGWPGTGEIERALWLRAEALLPDAGIEAYTQGLMDLGATLCTRSRPQCGQCPLSARCVALQTARVDALPARKPTRVTPERHAVMLVVDDGNAVLMEQRPPSGIWGGLLSLPEWPLQPETSAGTLVEQGARALVPGILPADILPLVPFVHAFTHFRLHVMPYRVRIEHRDACVDSAALRWLPWTDVAGAPLPAPIKKLLLSLQGDGDQALLFRQ